MHAEGVDLKKRRFLTATTAVVGAVGAGFAAVPFIASWNPSERAKALGAEMAFSGRSFFWGMGAMGKSGAHQVLEIFRDEIDRTLKQLGCGAFADMDESWLSETSGPQTPAGR